MASFSGQFFLPGWSAGNAAQSGRLSAHRSRSLAARSLYSAFRWSTSTAPFLSAGRAGRWSKWLFGSPFGTGNDSRHGPIRDALLA
jgi:hypothetical protein